jgi:hypothetical protein
MGEHDGDAVFGWFYIWHWAKRGGRMPDVTKISPSERPTMPRARWLRWAAACIAVGMATGAQIADAVNGSTARGVVLGAIVGLVLGIYVVETVWERGEQRRKLRRPLIS